MCQALTQLFSFPWSEHVGLHLLCSWLTEWLSHFHPSAMGCDARTLALSVLTSSAVGGFYFDHLTVVSPYSFLIPLLANGAAYVCLVAFLHRVSLVSVSVDGFCSFSNWTSSYCHILKVIYTFQMLLF